MGNEIQIKIKIASNNQIFTIKISKSDTIQTLKERCQNIITISPESQYLVYKDIILSNEKLVSNYKIENYDTIILFKDHIPPPTTNTNTKSKLIGVLFDVSGSMKKSYVQLAKSNYSIEVKSHSLINILTNLANNLKIDIFALLFGSKDGKILDSILLIKTIIALIKKLDCNIQNPKEEFLRLMETYAGHSSIQNYIYKDNGPTDEEISFICSLMQLDHSFAKKLYNNLPDIIKDNLSEMEKKELNQLIQIKDEFVNMPIEQLVSENKNISKEEIGILLLSKEMATQIDKTIENEIDK